MARNPETYAAPDLFKTGLGEVVVCRFKNDGRVEAGIFLVDVFCLGVKNAFFGVFPSEEEFRETVLVHSLANAQVRPGSWGRKLVEGAVSYARSLGISPQSDYKKGDKVFGGIQAEECEENFAFGQNGRPFFIQGPDDDPAACERIINALTIRLGEDGFDFAQASDEDSRAILALDSGADRMEPHPDLIRMAEQFLGENAEKFDEVCYGGPAEGQIAAALLQAAHEMQKTGADEGLPDLTIEAALNYLVLIYNMRHLSPEEREQASQALPEEMREGLTSLLGDEPEAEDPLLILQARCFEGDSSGPARLFLLVQPL
jgi:hypothetical protein